jgi:hypothetical protein
LQGGLVAKAGQEELRKDQDLCSSGQGAACHLRRSGDIFIGTARLYGKLEASGSHNKIGQVRIY